MTALLKYDEACRAVAEAKNFDEVRDWEDKAAAVREYSRRIHDRSMELDALEIRERARRRRGELLAALRAEGRLAKRGKISSTDDILTLDDLKVSLNESSRDQRIASLDGDSFERLVARCRAYAEQHPEKHSFDTLAAEHGLDKSERRAQRERDLGEKQTALPTRKYGVIVADPEWRFEPWSRATGMDRSADNHYPTSCTEIIAQRDVSSIAADDAVLFLWATAPMLPHALLVMAAWGFDYRSHAIWRKQSSLGSLRIGTGYWFRNAHELLLVGVRGQIPAPPESLREPSIIDGLVRAHSQKPDEFLELIEAWYPTLPKIELNRRGPPRSGWSAWGNEAEPELPPHDTESGEILEPPIEDTSLDIPAFLRRNDSNPWRYGTR